MLYENKMNKKINAINPHTAKTLKYKVFWVLNKLENIEKQRFSIKEITDYLVDVLGIAVTRQGVEYALKSDKKATHKNSEGYKLMEDGRAQLVLDTTKKILHKKTIAKSGTYKYAHSARITELKSIKSTNFDVTKLIRFCEELNTAFYYESYLSTAMLVRAIIDHIPPIFAKNTFTEVANNFGSKSFKDSMKNLDNSSRKIADSHLHTQIRNKEVLPNSNQVNFTNDLDVLLAEVYRILKQ
ncbi:MAG: hypothetical protein A2Y67_02175 [Candidatus Buchananbacteria bacterium RBG_13_39_9]|uniref:Uncharacterized protein n=1 Tax=Candidatus Buchananbacteria bacterium RBG_13_39_9 TaxID=1797531 RepID=A0A1G1XNM4_9BACT|nr:MAG: hypothetical protein A2Y67_02175 [Candidatus Buchananbacteria bacterium RBG_13_39_9]